MKINLPIPRKNRLTALQGSVLLSLLILSAQWAYSQVEQNTIVLIGSSTAAGIGASHDSSWARRYSNYLNEQNPPWQLINLAVPGFTTYRLMPTHFKSPPHRPHPDSMHNISKAISLKPKAIILALGSNDVVSGVPLATQKANYDSIVAMANTEHIPIWISTPLPRTKLDSTRRDILIHLNTWITHRYGEKSIDCWTTLAQADGKINPHYAFGDGVHENNHGHAIIFERVLQKNIVEQLTDSLITLPHNSLVNALEKGPGDSSSTQVIEILEKR